MSLTKDDTIAGAKFVTLSRRDLLAVQERNTVRHGVQMNLAVVVLEVTMLLHDVLATKTNSSRLLAVQSTDLYVTMSSLNLITWEAQCTMVCPGLS